MHITKIIGAQPRIISADKVDIEIDISNGLHSFVIVGLGDKSVDESKDRVSSAIKNSGFISPKQKNQKVVVSLAPANIRKNGPVFDLPIALVYLQASRQINVDLRKKMFIGELSLGGKIRYTKGVLQSVILAKEIGCEEVYIPKENSSECSIIKDIKIFPTDNLIELIRHLNNKFIEEIKFKDFFYDTKEKINIEDNIFNSIIGNDEAKRALTITASGGHNMCIFGPPGTGKTMLAKSICEIIPDLNMEQSIECTAIHSSVNSLRGPVIKPPFRNPHHTSSHVSLMGGGNQIRPGELSLAHNGVLFLDEFPEFDRRFIESLRQPLEEKHISISRAVGTEIFPANFIFIAAMNPCPCGYYNSNSKKCVCDIGTILKYQKKISGPITDRIDVWVKIKKINYKNIINNTNNKDVLKKTKDLVLKARKIQISNFKKLNNQLSNQELKNYVCIDSEASDILQKYSEKMQISIRSYFKILKVAKTISDIDDSKKIKIPHVLEALQYREKII